MTSSSVSDLQDQTTALPGPAGAHDRTERSGNPALASDDLPDIVLRHMEAKDGRVLALLLLDANGIGVVDEPAGQIGQQLSQYLWP